MTSSERFVGAGTAAGEELLLLHHPAQMHYHVPQHSRREKLRFPPAEESQASTSVLLLQDPSPTAPPLYPPPANSLAAFLPASSSAASSSYHQHHAYSAPQFDGRVAFPIPAQHRIPSQGFSLSLSSASSPRPPATRPHLASRPAPLGPFTGYATVLNRSRFLEPAKKLLEQVCNVGQHKTVGISSRENEMLLQTDPLEEPELSLVDRGVERLGNQDRGMEDDRHVPSTGQQWKKTTLVSLLDEVCRRYKQYYQQVQAVTSSFESVAGLSTASPFASTSLKAMCKHFRSLKNIISEQLRQANKGLGINKGTIREDSSVGFPNSAAYLQRTVKNTDTFAQPHVWRPQRGLPERAVAVLRAWLFEHFLHPYPTDVDKQNLAKQTGLSRNQVSNWFINARVRLWKPMVEEIHSLEMHQKNKTSPPNDNNPDSDEQPDKQPPSSSSKTNPCGSSQQFQLNHIQEPAVNYAYNGIANHQLAGAGGVGGNVVSLTLGLHHHHHHHHHQDIGVRLSEPLPINVARCFGLEECSEGYLVSTFDQERQLIGKDVGSRLLHDFVG